MLIFYQEISASVWGNLRNLNFKTTDDLLRWLDAEEAFWREANAPKTPGYLLSVWNEQRNWFNNLRTLLQNYISFHAAGNERGAQDLNQTIAPLFNSIANGTIITSDYDVFPLIAELAKSNPETAALLLVQARSDSAQRLGNFSNQGIPFKSLLSLIVCLMRSEGSHDWLQPQRKELTSLKGDSQAELDALRKEHGDQSVAILEQRKTEADALDKREETFSKFMTGMNSDWDKQKKVYDEQLALLAPTQYWAGRATAHFWTAIGFASAFAVALAISIWLFVDLAMPHLNGLATQKEVSPLLALIPVAVPAFAGIWVLRMLSRLLSENLQMMRDARERETMVKTFLAMMRDDTTGKSLINDEDRKLILQALFRPSKITSNDDAPPVSLLEVVTSKVSGKP